MTIVATRKIVKIDEEKCNGCGACELKCAEGALKIIDGKARLIGEVYCDGLGACLGECPQGAITIEERPAEEFDEKAVEKHLHEGEKVACGCPGAAVAEFPRTPAGEVAARPSELSNWPVQLTLVPPKAAFLKGADVVLSAQCAAFAYGAFHHEFIKERALIIACPKLDDIEAHLEKLTQIVAQSGLKSVTVVHMEVPCCSGLVYLAKRAIAASGRDVPLTEVTIGVRGEVLAQGGGKHDH